MPQSFDLPFFNFWFSAKFKKILTHSLTKILFCKFKSKNKKSLFFQFLQYDQYEPWWTFRRDFAKILRLDIQELLFASNPRVPCKQLRLNPLYVPKGPPSTREPLERPSLRLANLATSKDPVAKQCTWSSATSETDLHNKSIFSFSHFVYDSVSENLFVFHK